MLDHKFSLYEPLLHVPLIVRAPGRVAAGVRVSEPVPAHDLFGTVLTLAGAGPGGARTLPRGDRAPPSPPAVFSELEFPKIFIEILRREFSGWDFRRFERSLLARPAGTLQAHCRFRRQRGAVRPRERSGGDARPGDEGAGDPGRAAKTPGGVRRRRPAVRFRSLEVKPAARPVAAYCARTFRVRPTRSSIRAQLVVVGVLHAEPRVRHVAGLDAAAWACPAGAGVLSMIQSPKALRDLVERRRSREMRPSRFGAQRDDAGGNSGARAPGSGRRGRPPSPTRDRCRCRCRRRRGPTRARPAGGSRSRRTSGPSARRTTPCASRRCRCRGSR